MAKLSLDNKVLGTIASKVHELEVMFESIQDEITGSQIRTCVMCEIGRDIAQDIRTELRNLGRVSRLEVRHG
ncbi:hypothetical protein [Burkholderia cenocepacia]|uniref:hypothetical protein n=1 Tax=Burkholderia cenocepacia TaxID=95486 RepID=UPI0028765E15|nr:hypothetical protein [Burkholderia cenocepacia]MDS0802844.1 hypothetical protein [Burkholderia cenocepacia]